MGEYVLYAMKNLLWNFSEMPDTSRCLAILREDLVCSRPVR